MLKEDKKEKIRFYYRGPVMDYYDHVIRNPWECYKEAVSEKQALSLMAWEFKKQFFGRPDVHRIIKLDPKKLEVSVKHPNDDDFRNAHTLITCPDCGTQYYDDEQTECPECGRKLEEAYSKITLYYPKIELSFSGSHDHYDPTIGGMGGWTPADPEEFELEDYEYEVSIDDLKDALWDIIIDKPEYSSFTEDALVHYIDEAYEELLEKHYSEVLHHFEEEAREEAEENYESPDLSWDDRYGESLEEDIEKHSIIIDRPKGNGVFEILKNANYNVRKDESKPILRYIINYNDKDYEVIDYGWDKDNFFIDLDKSLLDEDIEKHEELNPKLFDENEELNTEVKETIEKIVDTFIKELHEDGVKFNLKDIILVGSNVSYNYTKDSDLDIHIIADSNGLECPDDLYPLLYSAYRSIFNKNYDITIKGIPAEIYVEIDKPAGISNGVYSLKDGWIKKPEPKSIPNLDKEAFDKLFKEWEEKYNQLLSRINEDLSDDIYNFIEDLYDLRKESIAKEGEYGLGNLVFKEFRNRGYLDNLKELRKQEKSKELSLEKLESSDDELYEAKLNESDNYIIKQYRKWANLLDSDEITADNLDQEAMNNVSAWENYDIGELKELLLKGGTAKWE